MEIERKFLIKNIPFDLSDYSYHEISQGYISTEPVIRIRKCDEKRILTIKSKGLMSRQEYELDLTEEEFANLSKKVSGNIISKTRYVIPETREEFSNLTMELDVFHDDFEGFIMAEVEFPDEETAKKYNPPAFICREVTSDNHFHNSNLSSMSKESILAFMASIRSEN